MVGRVVLGLEVEGLVSVDILRPFGSVVGLMTILPSVITQARFCVLLEAFSRSKVFPLKFFVL